MLSTTRSRPPLWLLMLLLWAPGSAVLAASREEIDARVQAALTRAYAEYPESQALARRASGILVFPRIVKAGFGIGGEWGEGALLVDGATADYYRMFSLSAGFQIGGQAKTEVVLFMTPDSLRQFRDSEGWEAGVDGSIAIIEFGVGREIDTHNIKDPIIAFVLDNRGLMYNLSLEGTKFWRVQK